MLRTAAWLPNPQPAGTPARRMSNEDMRLLPAHAALLSLTALATLGATFGFGIGTLAKDKPLSWKPIEDALLRVNDAAPKEWGAYRTGKKNEPLVLQIGNRFLFIQSHDHQVFELDPAKIEHKTGELLWSPSDRPAKPLATSEWNVDDIGAAFVVKVKLTDENALVDLQLPHPPDVGDLPQQQGAPRQTRRRNYFVGRKISFAGCKTWAAALQMRRCPTKNRRAAAGLLLQVFVEPAVDELDDLVAIPVQEHLVHVPVDAHVFEAHEIILGSSLIEPLGNADVEDAVVGAFGGERENAHILEADKLVRGLVLHVTANFIAGPF